MSRLLTIYSLCSQDQTSEEAQAFLSAAANNDDTPFGITSEEALFKAYEVEKDSVVMFKQFDGKRDDLTDDITTDSVAAFVAANQLPLLIEFTQDVCCYYIYHLIFV